MKIQGKTGPVVKFAVEESEGLLEEGENPGIHCHALLYAAYPKGLLSVAR